MIPKITIRKSVGDDLKEMIPDLIDKAVKWMQKKYPNTNFSNTNYIFSGGYNRSRYFRNEVSNGKYQAPNTCICTRATLYLYDKKSLGMKKNQLFVGRTVQTECALVHELTHHMQHESGVRVGNELDTTRNELEYLKDFYPGIYEELIN